jgi:hypothetical protein
MFFLLTGNRFLALSPVPDRFSRYCFVLRQNTSKLIWDMLILKILDSHPNGQALTSEIAREVALLGSAAQEIFLPSPAIEGGIFGAGFVTGLRKGCSAFRMKAGNMSCRRRRHGREAWPPPVRTSRRGLSLSAYERAGTAYHQDGPQQ